MIEAGLCNSTTVGELILAPKATAKSTNVILTNAMDLKDAVPINYSITKTGYYCVLAFGNSGDAKSFLYTYSLQALLGRQRAACSAEVSGTECGQCAGAVGGLSDEPGCWERIDGSLILAPVLGWLELLLPELH